MKYAIVFLCMLKDHYVIGACIAAYTHRCFINRLNNKNISLVIMCDDYIYGKYKDLLKIYFDKVKKIKLDKYTIDNDWKYAKEKYESWVAYATNKWQCLKYIKYDKILFLDIDILPAKLEFYNIFNLSSPAVLRCRTEKTFKCNEKIIDDIGKTYKDFVINKADTLGTIDGGIVLLTPNKKTYKRYKKMTDKIFKKAMYSSSNSFPDETSLFYFLNKKFDVYNICKEYCQIPWEVKPKENIINLLSYNYNGFYKPWIVGRSLCFPEQQIWHDIYDKLNINKQLTELYNISLLEHYEKIFLTLNFSIQKYRYNIDKIKINKINKNNLNDKQIFGIKNNNYGDIVIKYLEKCL